MMKRIAVATALTLVVIPTLGVAQSSPANDEHHGPSPEALGACKDKAEGDACEFDAPKGHVVGTCRKAKTGELACWHAHHHHDGGSP
jgi:hypothetical protein